MKSGSAHCTTAANFDYLLSHHPTTSFESFSCGIVASAMRRQSLVGCLRGAFMHQGSARQSSIHAARYLRIDLASTRTDSDRSRASAIGECSISTPIELCCRHLGRTQYSTCIFDMIVRLNSLGRSAALRSTSFAPELETF